MESSYFDLDSNRDGVAAGQHRNLVGGLWEELGTLQFEHLKQEGLRPEHLLLDVGCGSLRGGVHFISYLNPGHYFGIDINQSFLDAGYDIELAQAGLQGRMPRENLACTAEFQPPWAGVLFDFAIAQSVFTHLMLNRIRQCLTRIAPHMKPDGVFYATFFERPEDVAADKPIHHQPGGVTTYDVQDPYHYALEDLAFAIRGLPWRMRYIGSWDHPRGQKLIAFERQASGVPSVVEKDQRSLSVEEAGRLGPGANHYRAYVGPPDRFDFMSATQFSLLFQCGLRDHHRVLDFGAGSLRLGRLLIPYLQPGLYFAIDPNTWLIDDAIEQELGESAVSLKRPVFSSSDKFDCAVFGRDFDFVMAQSIVTHCGPALFRQLMHSVASVLEPDGLFLFSYVNTAECVPHTENDGWVYPSCVGYTEDEVYGFAQDAGLHAMAIPWYHPGASWMLAARSASRLPSDTERRLLNGAVLFDPQFAGSRMPQV